MDEQAEIELLIAMRERHSGITSMIDEAVAVGFLIEIGRWAKSELTERWKLRHDQQDTDLTDQAQVKTALSRACYELLTGGGYTW